MSVGQIILLKESWKALFLGALGFKTNEQLNTIVE